MTEVFRRKLARRLGLCSAERCGATLAVGPRMVHGPLPCGPPPPGFRGIAILGYVEPEHVWRGADDEWAFHGPGWYEAGDCIPVGEVETWAWVPERHYEGVGP